MAAAVEAVGSAARLAISPNGTPTVLVSTVHTDRSRLVVDPSERTSRTVRQPRTATTSSPSNTTSAPFEPTTSRDSIEIVQHRAVPRDRTWLGRVAIAFAVLTAATAPFSYGLALIITLPTLAALLANLYAGRPGRLVLLLWPPCSGPSCSSLLFGPQDGLTKYRRKAWLRHCSLLRAASGSTGCAFAIQQVRRCKSHDLVG